MVTQQAYSLHKWVRFPPFRLSLCRVAGGKSAAEDYACKGRFEGVISMLVRGFDSHLDRSKQTQDRERPLHRDCCKGLSRLWFRDGESVHTLEPCCSFLQTVV